MQIEYQNKYGDYLGISMNNPYSWTVIGRDDGFLADKYQFPDIDIIIESIYNGFENDPNYKNIQILMDAAKTIDCKWLYEFITDLAKKAYTASDIAFDDSKTFYVKGKNVQAVIEALDNRVVDMPIDPSTIRYQL